MVKQKSVWCCAECGHQQPKWLGQCPQCSQWNSFHQEIDLAEITSRFQASDAASRSKPVRVKEVEVSESKRLCTGMLEFDRLMGGGMVEGSLTLVGGEPGIGKSTLLLQASAAIAQQKKRVLYVCGEESVLQTSLRARRLGIEADELYLLSETNFAAIKQQIDQLRPALVIIDSIQIIYKSEIPSAPGSVSQVREVAAEFMHLAKGHNIAIILIGHVTKAGEIAGPRVLEHLVDTVLYFEGEQQHNYRMMRAVKNRFGATDEIALFQMDGKGLKEISNPSQIFLEERRTAMAGSVIIPTMEGSRPILVEVQALVTNTAFATPSRRSTGLDQNRLALLLAVLEKRMGYPLYKHDVFVSVAGGMRIEEPAVDLGVLIAITSSLNNRPIPPQMALMGEVGLGGEIRTVARVESRLKEAIQMGFSTCLIPQRNLKGLSKELLEQIHIVGAENVEEAVKRAFV